MAMFFSSSDGMNSWPSRANSASATANSTDADRRWTRTGNRIELGQHRRIKPAQPRAPRRVSVSFDPPRHSNGNQRPAQTSATG